MSEIIYSSKPDELGQHSAYFCIPIDVPIGHKQCGLLENDLRYYLRTKTALLPCASVRHDRQGSFIVKTTAAESEGFDGEEIASLKHLARLFANTGSWDNFPTIKALKNVARLNRAIESFNPSRDKIEDLIAILSSLPQTYEEAGYNTEKKHLKARMIEKFEETTGRKPAASEEGDIMAAIIEFDFTN